MGNQSPHLLKRSGGPVCGTTMMFDRQSESFGTRSHSRHHIVIVSSSSIWQMECEVNLLKRKVQEYQEHTKNLRDFSRGQRDKLRQVIMACASQLQEKEATMEQVSLKYLITVMKFTEYYRFRRCQRNDFVFFVTINFANLMFQVVEIGKMMPILPNSTT